MKERLQLPDWGVAAATLLLIILAMLLTPQLPQAGANGFVGNGENPYDGKMFWLGNNKGDGVGQIELGVANKTAPERITMACIDRSGKVLSGEQKDALEQILIQGGWPVYLGTFDPEIQLDDAKDVDNSKVKEQKNWYFNNGVTGKSAFQKWLQLEARLLKTRANTRIDAVKEKDVYKEAISAWTTLDDRQLNGNKREGEALEFFTQKGAYQWSEYQGQEVYMDPDHDDKWKEDNWSDAYTLSADEGRYLGDTISRIARTASNPVDAANKVPGGCISPNVDSDDLEIGDFFSGSIGRPINQLIFGFLGGIAEWFFGMFTPGALENAFFTAHSERGDTIWNLDDAEGGKGKDTRNGFIAENTSYENMDKAPWIKLAYFMQWIISGTYFIILFAAALMFIVRGNRSTSLQLTKVVPRILLSILFTITTVFTIGSLITISNMIASALAGTTGDTATVSTLTAVLASSTYILSIADDGGTLMPAATDADNWQQAWNVIVLMSAAGAGLVLWFINAMKQIILIVLIVAAPIAGLCLIVDSWRPKFFAWCCRLGYVAATPILLALIFKICLAMMPIDFTSDDVSSIEGMDGFMSTMMIIIALWAMAWVGWWMLKMAMFCQNKSFLRGAGAVASKVAPAAALVPGVGTAAAAAIGRAGSMAANMPALGDKVPALVPGGRESTAGGMNPQAMGSLPATGGQGVGAGVAAGATAGGLLTSFMDTRWAQDRMQANDAALQAKQLGVSQDSANFASLSREEGRAIENSLNEMIGYAPQQGSGESAADFNARQAQYEGRKAAMLQQMGYERLERNSATGGYAALRTVEGTLDRNDAVIAASRGVTRTASPGTSRLGGGGVKSDERSGKAEAGPEQLTLPGLAANEKTPGAASASSAGMQQKLTSPGSSSGGGGGAKKLSSPGASKAAARAQRQAQQSGGNEGSYSSSPSQASSSPSSSSGSGGSSSGSSGS